MPAAFSDKERIIIRQALLYAGYKFASENGMKKTTVDQLADKAGISKGAFYLFYSSKEELFFEVFEEFHDEFYDAVNEILRTRNDLPAPKRAAKAVLAVFTIIEEKSLLSFFENDLPVIMKKIPNDKLQLHFIDDRKRINDTIEAADIKLNVPFDTAVSVLNSIFYTFMHHTDIGSNANEALTILLDGAFEQIVKL